MCLVDCRQCLIYSFTLSCVHPAIQCVVNMCTQLYNVLYTMCIQLYNVLHTCVHKCTVCFIQCVFNCTLCCIHMYTTIQYTVCCVQTNVGRKLKNANFSIRSIRSKVDYQQPNIAQRLFCIQNERQDILYHLNFGCAVHTLDST